MNSREKIKSAINNFILLYCEWCIENHTGRLHFPRFPVNANINKNALAARKRLTRRERNLLKLLDR